MHYMFPSGENWQIRFLLRRYGTYFMEFVECAIFPYLIIPVLGACCDILSFLLSDWANPWVGLYRICNLLLTDTLQQVIYTVYIPVCLSTDNLLQVPPPYDHLLVYIVC